MSVLFISEHSYCQSVDELNKLRIAEALEQSGDYKKALDFYQELYDDDPSNFVYFDGVRRNLMSLKEYSSVEGLIMSRLKTDTSNVILICQLGDAYYKSGSPDSAGMEWQRALATGPGNPNTYRTVAGFMVANRLFDNAIKVYRTGDQVSGSKGIFVTDIARLYFLNMDYKESLGELLKLLDTKDQNFAVNYIESQLGAYLTSRDALSQFVSEMEDELKKNPDDVRYRQIMAFLYMEVKDYPGAYSTYKWLDEHSGSRGTELMNFADRAYNDEAFDVSANAYKEVSEIAEDKSLVPRALMGYGNSLRSLGERDYAGDDRPCSANDSLKDLDAALAVFESIISDFPASQFTPEAVMNSVEIRMNYFDDLAGAEKLVSQFPDLFGGNDYEGTMARARLFTMEGKFKDALGALVGPLSATRASGPEYDRLKYEAALALYYMGLYDSASYYLGQIAVHPESDAANDAIRLQNIISDNNGNPPALRAFADAEAMGGSNRIPEAAVMFSDIIKSYPQMPLADNARLELAEDYCRMGKVEEALKLYGELAQDSTGIFADRAEYRIGRLYEITLKQKDSAISTYEDFLRRFPNSIYQDKVRTIIAKLMNENS